MLDWLQKLLSPEVIEKLTGLAVNSGPAFFAVFLLLVGVAVLTMGKTNIVRYSGVGLLLFAGLMMAAATFGDAPGGERYKFVVHDPVSTETHQIGLEAAHGSDVWLKSKNDQKDYHALTFFNDKVNRQETITLFVRTPEDEVLRTPAPRCANEGAVYRIIETIEYDEDRGDTVAHYEIAPRDESCDPLPALTGDASWISIAGAAYAQEITVELPKRGFEPSRLFAATDIVVRYYEKEADQGVVVEFIEGVAKTSEYKAPAKIGEFEYSLSTLPVKSRSQHLPTNSIWYGEEVPVEVAADIAEGLIAQGVEIRYFGPFVFSDTRINTVEVGYSKKQSANDALTKDDIAIIVCRELGTCAE